MSRRDDSEGGASVGSTKPYLIRALYEWCVDNGFTPYLSVAVDPSTQVPKAYVKDGQIVLNLSPEAVHQLVLGNDYITCSARFGGIAQSVSVPVGRVAALYARENGNGMAFEVEEMPETKAPETEPEGEAEASEPVESPPKGERPKRGRPHLTRIK